MFLLYSLCFVLSIPPGTAAFDTMSECLSSSENYGLQYTDPEMISSCTVMHARVRCLDNTHCDKNSELYRREVRYYEQNCGGNVLQTIEDFQNLCGSSLKRKGMNSRDVIILSIVLSIVAVTLMIMFVYYLWHMKLYCFRQPEYSPNFQVAPAFRMDQPLVPPYPSMVYPPIYNEIPPQVMSYVPSLDAYTPADDKSFTQIYHP